MKLNYLPSDGGRAASGRKGTTGDCVVRAAALLLGHRQGLDLSDQGTPAWGEVYDSTYRVLAAANKAAGKSGSARNGTHRSIYQPVFLNGFGFVKVSLPSGPRPTWAQAHHLYGACVVSTARHIACLAGGALCDLFDGRTYQMENRETGAVETKERKAQAVYRLA